MKRLNKVQCGILCFAMMILISACGEEQEQSVQESNMEVSGAEVSSVEGIDVEYTGETIFAEAESDVPRISVLLPCTSEDLHKTSNMWYDKLIEEVNEYTGFNTTWKWYLRKTYAAQIEQEIQSGQLGTEADVIQIWANRMKNFWKSAEDGMFWDLSPYIDDESYDNLAEMPEAVRMSAYYNGKMYGIPVDAGLIEYPLAYRKDWLENLEMESPTDWESFCNMLYAFTYNDPDRNGKDDTVGLFLDANGLWLDVMELWFGVPNVWGIDENGDLVHKTKTQEYREAYAAFRQLYMQGVINNGKNGIPDFRKMSGNEKEAMAVYAGFQSSQGGAVIASVDDIGRVHDFWVEQKLTTEDILLYDLVPGIDTGEGIRCYPYLYDLGEMLAIPTESVADETELKTVLQFINDTNDGACYNLLTYGWEGISYELNEDGYIRSRFVVPEDLVATGAGESWQDGFSQLALQYAAEENGGSLYGEDRALPHQVMKRKLNDEYQDNCVINYGAQFISDTYALKGEELEALLLDAEVKYIIGELDTAGFEEALQSWWECGGEQITFEINEQYHAAGY